jgi:hypothetical protein
LSNPQLVEIDRSLHAIVRRAYDLGRDDALQKVVDVIRADKSCGDRLALMAPETSVLDQNMANGGAANPDVPWWARRAR